MKKNCLPSIYWIPKLHKNPNKVKFMKAVPECSSKSFSKSIISKTFKLIYNQIETYKKQSNLFSGINNFWTNLNNSFSHKF